MRLLRRELAGASDGNRREFVGRGARRLVDGWGSQHQLRRRRSFCDCPVLGGNNFSNDDAAHRA